MAASPETPPANSSSPPSFSDLIPPSPPDKPGPSPPQESPPPPAESSPPPSPPSSPPPAQSKSPPPSPPASTPSPPVSSPPTASSSPPPPSSPADSNNGTGSSSPPSPPPPPGSFVSPPLPANELAPPPPPPHKAPPSHRSSVSSPSSSPSSGSSLSPSQKYTILGVVAGAGLLLLLVVVALTVACTRKKKKKKKPPTNYYMDPQVSRAGEYYYNGNNSQRTPPHWGNTGSLGPSHGTMATPQHQHAGWPQQTPLPTINSGEMSGSFSSPYSAGRPPPQPTLSIGLNKSTFSYEELAAATDDFAQENILGQGGFGYVLKGVLPNGKEVAVKCLRQGSGQGDREFQAEVEIISRVHHRHLVSLVGYCIAGEQRMLVYEFLPNKTLEHHLHGKDPPPMDWPTRLKIAIGMAKGIAYLHEDCHPRIIHRDIKAANILLDMNFEAKVADFGLAKLSSDNFTHVSTRIMGTFGYLAPEYAASGKLTEKSDVFSFGVMLLELITGRKPVDTTGQYADMDESLVDWARPLITQALEDGNCSTLADPTLGGIYNPHEMARMIACAGACIRHSARRRPKMSQVVHALEGDASLDDLHDWTKPGSTSSAMGSGSSEENNSGSYTEDMKKFRKMAFQNHDYASSEFGATSEYGLNPSSSSSSDSREVSSMATSKRNIR